MIGTINPAATSPPPERANRKPNFKLFPYTHSADGEIRAGVLTYVCPRCGELQALRVPTGIFGSVNVATITRCCQRAVVIYVSGTVEP